MRNRIELTCGNCSKSFIIPNGEQGMVYTCPNCGANNRAAHQAAAVTQEPRGRLVVGLVCGAALMGAYLWFSAGNESTVADPQRVNAIAFALIADAHGEAFIESASRTDSALADAKDLVNRTQGVELDPDIRDFAQMQADYERAMSAAVATEREAHEHPGRVPLDLWRVQLAYHQAASRLAAKYRPDWGSGLKTRIEHDKKMIRQLGG